MIGHWTLWARAASQGRPGAVVAVVGPWQDELPALCTRFRIAGCATCPTTGALCLWLLDADDLLLLAPAPPKHGSNTPGVLLPW